MPLAWDELDGLRSATQWTVANADARLDDMASHDPWVGYAGTQHALTRAASRLMRG